MKLLTANCWQSQKNLFSAITEQGYKSQLQTEITYVEEKITKFQLDFNFATKSRIIYSIK